MGKEVDSTTTEFLAEYLSNILSVSYLPIFSEYPVNYKLQSQWLMPSSCFMHNVLTLPLQLITNLGSFCNCNTKVLAIIKFNRLLKIYIYLMFSCTKPQGHNSYCYKISKEKYNYDKKSEIKLRHHKSYITHAKPQLKFRQIQ
jgi:hypothetical protein